MNAVFLHAVYDSGQEGINHFTNLGGDYLIIFSRIQYSSSDLVIFQHGSHSLDHQKVGYMGVDPGCHRCVYLILSYHIHDVVYHGGSQDHGDPSCEVGQIWNYEGYLVLIMALDSIYLNPYDDIANRSSEAVSQACIDDLSTYKVWERPNIQRVIFDEPWHNGVDLGTVVQESHAYLPIDSYSGYVLDPVPLVKWVRIQEGSLHLVFYTLGVLSWGTFGMVAFPWGAKAPFFGAIPSLQFKWESVLDSTTSGQSGIKLSGLLQW